MFKISSYVFSYILNTTKINTWCVIKIKSIKYILSIRHPLIKFKLQTFVLRTYNRILKIPLINPFVSSFFFFFLITTMTFMTSKHLIKTSYCYLKFFSAKLVLLHCKSSFTMYITLPLSNQVVGSNNCLRLVDYLFNNYYWMTIKVYTIERENS